MRDRDRGFRPNITVTESPSPVSAQATMEALEANLVYLAVLEAASCSDAGLRTAVAHGSGEQGVISD